MADKVFTGVVQADGRIITKETVDLPPGEEIHLILQLVSPAIEEARRQIEAMQNHVMTPEEEAEYHRIHAALREKTFDDPELPDDYIDELAHYMYGTPKRSEASK
jgi:hypothetical protein